MMIAIPMGRNGLSGHTAKADSFLIQNPTNGESVQLENPAKAGGCGGKAELLNQLQQHKVDKVLVRHIGGRMLARLLDAGIRVFKISDNKQQDLQALLTLDSHQELTDASQGDASPNYQRKLAEGKAKCCGHGGNKRHSLVMNSNSNCSGKGHCCGKH